MKLNSITLKNFKSIGAEPQTIDLAPITLLFGPNSAGKSTVLQSLLFLHEVLEKGNLNPDKTELGGEVVDLGGFINLLNNKNELAEMEIGLNIGEFGEFHDFLSSETDADFAEFGLNGYPDWWMDNVENIDINFTFAWSAGGPVAKYLGVKFNGEKIGKIGSTDDGKQVIVEELNLDHKIFSEARYKDNDNEFEDYFRDVADATRYQDWHTQDNRSKAKALTVANQEGAIPNLQRSLAIDLDSWLDVGEHKTFYDGKEIFLKRALITSVLSMIFVDPLSILKDFLNNLTYIGPLRDLPPRSWQSQLSPDKSRWAKGIAAWEVLTSVEDNTVEDLNVWLGEKHFNTGYELNVKKYREVEEGTFIDNFVQYGLMGYEIEEVREKLKTEFDQLSKKVQVSLIETFSNIEVKPQDIGIGISQLLPVLVAASYKNGLIAVEQPELHLHPKVQVELGDFFIEQATKKNTLFLIETHSEHLLLRVLRRIRENYSENHEGKAEFTLSLDQISVVYVERKESGAHYSNQIVTEQGDFDNDWPDGFFEERDDELYI